MASRQPVQGVSEAQDVRPASTDSVSEPKIPNEVLSLLHERLSGLHEIKVLLLLHGDPSRTWSAPAVAEALRWPEPWAGTALENLAAAGLVVGIGDGLERRFSYLATTIELDAAAGVLADIHGEDGLQLMRILNSSALDRVRSAAATLGDVIARAKGRPEADE
jgi:hypothetical protein